MLKAAENMVKIEGILSEVDLEKGSYMKDGKTHERISGTIKIKVNQVINGVEKELDVPVSLFANKLKNDGAPNPAYASIEKIKNEFVSIAASPNGIEGADRVRITNGNIRMNEFYNQNGVLVSYPRISATFVSKVANSQDFSPEASFSSVFVIAAMGHETDKDGVDIPDRFKVRGVIPQYGGAVDVVDFIAVNPNVIEAVSSYWTEGDTVKINGKLNFSSTTEERLVKVDFGEPRKEKRTINVSELIITGGSQTPLEGDFAYDSDEIHAALEERQSRLAALKANQKSNDKSASAKPAKKASFSNLGF